MRSRHPRRDAAIEALAHHLTVRAIADLEWHQVEDRGLAGVVVYVGSLAVQLSPEESAALRAHGPRSRGRVVDLTPRGVRGVLERRSVAVSCHTRRTLRTGRNSRPSNGLAAARPPRSVS